MALSDIPEERKAQLTAIEIELATARDYIRDDLKAKFGHGENKFFDLDLIEYRINNSCEDIAEDLDVKSLYGIESDKILRPLISKAFRGHHDEEFMPDYQFDGLFGKITNDMIERQRKSKAGRIGGQIVYEQGVGIHAQTPEERIKNGRIAGRKSMALLSDEERSELARIGGLASNEAQGNHSWSLEEIVEIGELKYGEGLTWKDTTSEMNERYDKDYTTNQVKLAYHTNKHRIADEEE
jgi:hypothetical protein